MPQENCTETLKLTGFQSNPILLKGAVNHSDCVDKRCNSLNLSRLICNRFRVSGRIRRALLKDEAKIMLLTRNLYCVSLLCVSCIKTGRTVRDVSFFNFIYIIVTQNNPAQLVYLSTSSTFSCSLIALFYLLGFRFCGSLTRSHIPISSQLGITK